MIQYRKKRPNLNNKCFKISINMLRYYIYKTISFEILYLENKVVIFFVGKFWVIFNPFLKHIKETQKNYSIKFSLLFLFAFASFSPLFSPLLRDSTLYPLGLMWQTQNISKYVQKWFSNCLYEQLASTWRAENSMLGRIFSRKKDTT